MKYARTEELIEEKGMLGEASMEEVYESVVRSDIIATKPSTVCYITDEEFEQAIGGGYNEVLDANSAESILRSVRIFRGMPDQILIDLYECMTCKTFEDGEVIVEQHSIGYRFFIIKSGEVEAAHNG